MKLFEVKNDENGRQFVSELKRKFRNTPHFIMIRGRGDRKTAAKGDMRLHAQYRQDLPLQLSERLAVYINDRPKTRVVPVVKQVTEYKIVPTKWAAGGPS